MACKITEKQVLNIYTDIYEELKVGMDNPSVPAFDIASYMKDLYDDMVDTSDPDSVQKTMLSIQAVPDIYLQVALREDVKSYILKTRKLKEAHMDIMQMSKDFEDLNTVSKFLTTAKVSKKYVYNDPNLWVFVITDHISLLTPEKGETLHEAMGRYSKQFCLKGFTKKYNCVTINIQQQEASKEKLEYFQGQSIDEKLEPSLDGLANNKETQRECNLILGVFAPERYNIGRHRGYDIKKLGNKYRSLKILKDRDNGLVNYYIGMFFNGAANYFEELPTADTIDYTKYQ
jgi:hypothetical protein